MLQKIFSSQFVHLCEKNSLKVITFSYTHNKIENCFYGENLKINNRKIKLSKNIFQSSSFEYLKSGLPLKILHPLVTTSTSRSQSICTPKETKLYILKYFPRYLNHGRCWTMPWLPDSYKQKICFCCIYAKPNPPLLINNSVVGRIVSPQEEVLTPSTYIHGLIWKQKLRRCYQVKLRLYQMRASSNDQCLYKRKGRRFRHRGRDTHWEEDAGGTRSQRRPGGRPPRTLGWSMALLTPS